MAVPAIQIPLGTPTASTMTMEEAKNLTIGLEYLFAEASERMGLFHDNLKDHAKCSGRHFLLIDQQTGVDYHVTTKEVWENITPKSGEDTPKGTVKEKVTSKKPCGEIVARLKGKGAAETAEAEEEFQTASLFKGKRGIVSVHDFIKEIDSNGEVHFTLYADNYELGDGVYFHGSDYVATPEELDNITEDLIYGLHAVQSAGYAHRDVKNDNIVLSLKGGLKAGLIDFGFCKKVSQDEISAAGSPHYAAPEKFHEKWTSQKDLAGDVFALGIILATLTDPNRKDKNLRNIPPWFDIDPANVEGVCNYLASKYKRKGAYFKEPDQVANPKLHLIWRMCQYNAQKRPTIEEVLKTWNDIQEPVESIWGS